MIACIDKESLKTNHDKLYQSVPRMGARSPYWIWRCACSLQQAYVHVRARVCVIHGISILIHLHSSLRC